MATVGQQILDGKAVIIAVDPAGLVLGVEITALPADPLGQHPTVTFNVGQDVAAVTSMIQALLTALGI